MRDFYFGSGGMIIHIEVKNQGYAKAVYLLMILFGRFMETHDDL